MIWLWLLARHRHQWSTGQLDRYFAFLCAHCGISTSAMVRTFGHGSGSSHAAAERSANASADAFAFRAVSAASCPCCSQLQPAVHEQFERATKKVARNASLRLPLALVASVILAIILAIPAVGDMHESVMLALVACSTAAAAGALVFAIFAGPVATPNTNPAGVWFSRDPQVPGSWFPAQPGQAPVVTQPPRALRVLSLVALGVTGLSAIVALVLWKDTFRNIYVVSAEGERGALSVHVDGGKPRVVGGPTSDDAPNTKFEVRTSSTHKVVVTAGDRETSYELDPASAKHGWVLAPHGRERGLCLASLTWYYGTTPKEGDDALLNGASDLVVLPRSFDHVFTAPPLTVQTHNGSTETRTALRALDCELLEGEKIVPFRSAARPTD